MPDYFRTTNGLILFGLSISIAIAVLLAVVTDARALAGIAVGATVFAVIVLLLLLQDATKEGRGLDLYAQLAETLDPFGSSERTRLIEFCERLLKIQSSSNRIELSSVLNLVQVLGHSESDPHSSRDFSNRLAAATSIRDGRLIVPKHERPEITDLYFSLNGPVWATTGSKDKSWWGKHSDVYLDANRQAHEIHGKEIERIFVLEDLDDTEMHSIMARNQASGVKVFVVSKSEVEARKKPYLLINMTIFGEQFVHRDINNDDGETVEYLYSSVYSDVVRLSNIFLELRDISRLLPKSENSVESRLFEGTTHDV